MRRFFGADQVPDEWRPFVNAVDAAYREFDEDRLMLERSLDLSSQELMQANSEMRGLVQAIPDCILRLDSNGTILGSIAGSHADLPLPDVPLTGQKVDAMPGMAAGAALRHAIDQVHTTRSMTEFEYTLASDGKTRTFEARVLPLEGGELLAVLRNVTNRRRTENALRESEERFRELAGNVRDVFWMRSLDLSKVLYVSPAYEEIWARSRESLYEDARSYLAGVHPEDRARANETLAAQARCEPFEHEYRVLRPDGTVRWVHDRGFPVRNDAGRVYRFAGIARDITDRKAAEQQHRRVADRYKALFERNLAGVFRATLDTASFECNDAFKAMMGVGGTPYAPKR